MNPLRLIRDVRHWVSLRRKWVASWMTHFAVAHFGTHLFLALAVTGRELFGLGTRWGLYGGGLIALFYLGREAYDQFFGGGSETADFLGDWVSALYGFVAAVMMWGGVV